MLDPSGKLVRTQRPDWPTPSGIYRSGSRARAVAMRRGCATSHRLVGSRDPYRLLRSYPGKEPVADNPKEPWRQQAIRRAFRPLAREEPQVGAGPDEVIEFIEDDPGPLRVQAEPHLQRGRDLDGRLLTGGWRVHNRQ